jgi:hypothetical protein
MCGHCLAPDPVHGPPKSHTWKYIIGGVVAVVVLSGFFVIAWSLRDWSRPDADIFAEWEIRLAKHPCAGVQSASRMPDGGVIAACTNGETYHVMPNVDGHSVVIKCSAADCLEIKNAC